jgi:hypothetical protein
MVNNNPTNRDMLLKSLSPQAFLALGNGHIAYIRALDVAGNRAFAIHAADGSVLTLTDSFDSAVMLVRQNELDAVTLQ